MEESGSRVRTHDNYLLNVEHVLVRYIFGRSGRLAHGKRRLDLAFHQCQLLCLPTLQGIGLCDCLSGQYCLHVPQIVHTPYESEYGDSHCQLQSCQYHESYKSIQMSKQTSPGPFFLFSEPSVLICNHPKCCPGSNVLYGHPCQSHPCDIWLASDRRRAQDLIQVTHLLIDPSSPPIQITQPSPLRVQKTEKDNHYPKCQTTI